MPTLRKNAHSVVSQKQQKIRKQTRPCLSSQSVLDCKMKTEFLIGAPKWRRESGHQEPIVVRITHTHLVDLPEPESERPSQWPSRRAQRWTPGQKLRKSVPRM